MARLDTIIIATVIGCFFISAGIMVINDAETNYNVGISEGNFGNITSKVNYVTGSAENTSETLREKLLPNSISSSSAFDIIFAGAYTTVTAIWNFFTLPAQLVGVMIDYFNAPPLIGTLVKIILMVSMTFSIIYMIFKFQPR